MTMPAGYSRRTFLADLGRGGIVLAVVGVAACETLLVGHGEPILSGASGQVAALGAR